MLFLASLTTPQHLPLSRDHLLLDKTPSRLCALASNLPSKLNACLCPFSLCLSTWRYPGGGGGSPSAFQELCVSAYHDVQGRAGAHK